MKLSHKIIMLSAAALMGVSPVLGTSPINAATAKASVKKTATKTASKSSSKKASKTASKSTTQKAVKKTAKNNKNASAKKSTQTTKNTFSKTNNGDQIKIGNNSYVYYANGKRNKNYKVGKKTWPVIGKGAKLSAYGTKTINGKLYYSIGNGNYIKAVNVATINGKKNPKAKIAKTNSKKSPVTKKIKLIHNAYVYNKNGKRIKSAGKLTKGSTISYLNVKKIKGKTYFNLGKGQYVKTTNAKYQKPEDIPDPTYIELVHNSIVYDENGEAYEPQEKYFKGQQFEALAAKEINDKWYYQVGNDGVNTKWIKAVNAAVISGPELIHNPDFNGPTINNNSDAGTAIVTLRANPIFYNVKGKQISLDFNAGHTARVDEARYIYIAAQNQVVMAYRLASYPSAYVTQNSIANINGASLTPKNTAEEAQEAGTIATAADKQALNAAISSANSVKASSAYTLASESAKSAYDSAISKGQSVSNSTTSSVLDVKNALAAIQKAQSALTGSKVQVADMNNLSASEQAAIIQLAASANNVSSSNVQFTNNNTQLIITGSDGYQRTVSVSDYAVQASTTPSTNNN